MYICVYSIGNMGRKGRKQAPEGLSPAHTRSQKGKTKAPKPSKKVDSPVISTEYENSNSPNIKLYSSHKSEISSGDEAALVQELVLLKDQKQKLE